MSYIRVNLLKKSEQRYQGPVSRRFLWVSGIATPILALALLSTIKLLQHKAILEELEMKRYEWTEIKPKLDRSAQMTQTLQNNRKILTLLENWEQSRIPIVELMSEIQDIVPMNMQFTRITIGGMATLAIYESPEEMELENKLLINGAVLEKDDFRQFLERLQKNKKAISSFPDIRQNGSFNSYKNREGKSLEGFSIIGSSKEEEEL